MNAAKNAVENARTCEPLSLIWLGPLQPVAAAQLAQKLLLRVRKLLAMELLLRVQKQLRTHTLPALQAGRALTRAGAVSQPTKWAAGGRPAGR